MKMRSRIDAAGLGMIDLAWELTKKSGLTKSWTREKLDSRKVEFAKSSSRRDYDATARGPTIDGIAGIASDSALK
jgi:hypothetical protein